MLLFEANVSVNTSDLYGVMSEATWGSHEERDCRKAIYRKSRHCPPSVSGCRWGYLRSGPQCGAAQLAAMSCAHRLVSSVSLPTECLSETRYKSSQFPSLAGRWVTDRFVIKVNHIFSLIFFKNLVPEENFSFDHCFQQGMLNPWHPLDAGRKSPRTFLGWGRQSYTARERMVTSPLALKLVTLVSGIWD